MTPEDDAKTVVELSQIRRWRKVGDEQWKSIAIPLKSEGTKELQFVFGQYQKSQFTCAICGKSLSETLYLLYRTVPQTAPRERYCLDHSPIPIETQEGPGLFQRLEDLERRVAELEARMGSDVDSKKVDGDS